MQPSNAFVSVNVDAERFINLFERVGTLYRKKVMPDNAVADLAPIFGVILARQIKKEASERANMV